jgi:hypothetical protein
MDETAEMLRNEGTYITTIDDNGFIVSLYSMCTELYEVFYNQTESRIVKISQASDSDLGKYLSRIKLSL